MRAKRGLLRRGSGKNAALLRHLDKAMFRAKADACMQGGWCTYFCEFEYRTAELVGNNVVGKAQVNPKGENPRFIVTNLPGDRRVDAWELYRGFYCARGDMENRVKEQQLDLFVSRMSCEAMTPTSCGCGFRPSPTSS
ncbi:MAG: transposase [Verrucomicrobiales bacterium]